MPPSPERRFIYLATPCYGGLVNIVYLRSVMTLQAACEARGIGVHVELLANDALITRARARLAARFLAHPHATHLFFVDADIGFSPESVFRLLDADKGIAGGVAPLKHIDWDKVRAAAKEDAPDLMAKGVGYVVRFVPTPDSSVEVEGGFAKVSYVGNGFMMIRRETLARVGEAHPELTADLSDVEPGLERVAMVFDTMIEPETGQHLSEDYALCRRWRDLGGEIWADVESRLTHVGHAAYSGSLLEAMRRG
ncbi:MAG: hypothetical protein JWR43_1898 [Phenylobacterium sp.]|nr:hypothetical protein [Phenylobacterium sp.]